MSNLYSLIVIFLLFQSCAGKITRKPSSASSPSLPSSCYQNSRINCLKQYPWNLMIKRNFELEYHFLNRQNKSKVLFNQCTLDKVIKCSSEKNKNRFKKLKDDPAFQKALLEINNNTPFYAFKNMTSFANWKNRWLILKALYLKLQDSIKIANQKIKLNQNYSHGYGGGISAGVTLGISRNYHLEFVVHKNKMALFCAPAVKLTSSVGLGADISFLTTRGCKSNEDYRGKFLSFEGSTPIVGLGYSVGMDVSNFVEQFLKLITDNVNFKNNLLKQIKKINRHEDFNLYPVPYSNEQDKYTYHKKIINLKNILDKYNFHDYSELNDFIDLLIKNTNNCDAITLSVGPDLAIPVNASIALYHYVQLTEINLNHIKEFLTMPFNENFDMVYYKKIYNELSKNFNDLNINALRSCHKKASTQMYHDFHYLIEIFSSLHQH